MTPAHEAIDVANILDLYRGEPGSVCTARPGSDNRNGLEHPNACDHIYRICARWASVETFPRAVFLTGAAR